MLFRNFLSDYMLLKFFRTKRNQFISNLVFCK